MGGEMRVWSGGWGVNRYLTLNKVGIVKYDSEFSYFSVFASSIYLFLNVRFMVMLKL